MILGMLGGRVGGTKKRFAQIGDDAKRRADAVRRADEAVQRVLAERRSLIRKTGEPQVRRIVKSAARGLKWQFTEDGTYISDSRYYYCAKMSERGRSGTVGPRSVRVSILMNEGSDLSQPNAILVGCYEEGYDQNVKLPGGNSVELGNLTEKLEEATRIFLGL
jgi:hypothetical protein